MQGHPRPSPEQLHTILSPIVFIGQCSGKPQGHSQNQPQPATDASPQQVNPHVEADEQSQNQAQLDTAAPLQQADADGESSNLRQAAEGQSQAVTAASDGLNMQAISNGERGADNAQEGIGTLHPEASSQQACQDLWLQVKKQLALGLSCKSHGIGSTRFSWRLQLGKFRNCFSISV